MRKSLLPAGACVLSLALSAGVATAGDRYNGDDYGRGYDNGGYYDNGRYGGNQDSYYRAYVRFLRECRKHRRVHRDLREEHGDAHREGFDDRGDHHEEHDALRDVHGQYHRNNPIANSCPTYQQWRNRHYSRGYDRRDYNNRGYRYGDD